MGGGAEEGKMEICAKAQEELGARGTSRSCFRLTQTRTHTHTYAHAHARMQAHTHAHTHTQAHTHTPNTHTHTHTLNAKRPGRGFQATNAGEYTQGDNWGNIDKRGAR